MAPWLRPWLAVSLNRPLIGTGRSRPVSAWIISISGLLSSSKACEGWPVMPMTRSGSVGCCRRMRPSPRWRVPAIPKNVGDAVRRIGSGLDGAVLSPLGFAGLLSAYRVLDVLAHNNYLSAVILAEQLDLELPDRLAAITTHLAAAGATAVTFALADDGSSLDARNRTVRDGRATRE